MSSRKNSFAQLGAARRHGIGHEHVETVVRKRVIDEAKAAIQKKPPPDYAIRPMQIDDAPFVIDSWARSYLHSARASNISTDVYTIEQRARIDRLIQRSIVLVLTTAQDPSYVSGYICFEPPKTQSALPILHYVLVHANLQGQKLGSRLFQIVAETRHTPEDPVWTTHWTFPIRKLSQSWNLIFNPYLLEVAHVKPGS